MKSVNFSNLLHSPPPVQKDLLKAQEGDKEVRELAKNITMPLLILWGLHDRVREGSESLSCSAIFLPPKTLIYTTPYLQTSVLLQICDVSGASILHSLVPKSEVAVLEKCGHAISLERPRKCSSLLTHFISHITTPL